MARAQSVYPALAYADADAAIDWLGRAFGFQPHEVHRDGGGGIVHAELVAGDALIMLGSDQDEGPFGSHAGQGWLYVVVDDPDAHHARAVAAGAVIVRPLENTDYGSRDYSARDLEGNLWSFGTYRPTG